MAVSSFLSPFPSLPFPLPFAFSPKCQSVAAPINLVFQSFSAVAQRPVLAKAASAKTTWEGLDTVNIADDVTQVLAHSLWFILLVELRQVWCRF